MNDTAKVVVDSSVLVKWFVEEDGSAKALRIRDKYIEGEVEIIVPELVTFETLNALRYKGLFKDSEIKEISEALDAFAFRLYSLKGEYARSAIDIAFKNDITIYDSSYISLAMLENAIFYTADSKLIGRLKKGYIKFVRNIREL
ncbi:MAG: type II toxin-antitoxin system VapC family toxin [Candidatus Bathyarchaeia archaeon]